jgi:hypothetical protein
MNGEAHFGRSARTISYRNHCLTPPAEPGFYTRWRHAGFGPTLRLPVG